MGKEVLFQAIDTGTHHETRGMLGFFHDIGYHPVVQEHDTEIGGIGVFFYQDSVGKYP